MAKQEEIRQKAPTPDSDERRRHSRIHIPLKARFLAEDGVERPCLVINISAGGALLRAKSPPKEKERVVIYIDEVGRFEASVVRTGKHSFAVDYRGRRTKSKRTADSLMATLHGQKTRTDRRIEPRIKQDQPATVILENGDRLACAILDISLTGALLAIEPRPALGAAVTVGRMSAKVVRHHEKGVGVVFTGAARGMEDAINQTAPDAGSPATGAGIAPASPRRA